MLSQSLFFQGQYYLLDSPTEPPNLLENLSRENICSNLTQNTLSNWGSFYFWTERTVNNYVGVCSFFLTFSSDSYSACSLFILFLVAIPPTIPASRSEFYTYKDDCVFQQLYIYLTGGGYFPFLGINCWIFIEIAGTLSISLFLSRGSCFSKEARHHLLIAFLSDKLYLLS